MAVCASPVEHDAAGCQLGLAGMARRVVALLAQAGWIELQQLGTARPMSVVTVQATLDYRRVLPQEGPRRSGWHW